VLEVLAILIGDDAAENNGVFEGVILWEPIDDLRYERVVGARQDQNPEDLNVFLDGYLHDLFG